MIFDEENEDGKIVKEFFFLIKKRRKEDLKILRIYVFIKEVLVSVQELENNFRKIDIMYFQT